MGKQLPVTFTVSGVATGAMRNDLSVAMRSPDEATFELATDEGKFHGGEGTAPPPLAHFVAGWAGCITTRIRAFARKMRLDFSILAVGGSADWLAEMRRFGGYECWPVRFVMDVRIESSEDPERLLELVSAARKGCFVEQSLRKDLDVDFRVHINESAAVPSE